MTDKADNDALVRVSPEMLDAWVKYDPPYTELPWRPAAIHGAIQSAFYGGYAAALRTPQPDETETLRAEVVSDGAVFTIRVELEHGVSGANSTQIHTSVHTKAGANANPMIVMDAAMKALADENAALHQCPAHKVALKGTDHARG